MRHGVVDVAYPNAGGAVAALVVASDPRYAAVESEHVVRLDHAAAYQPGRFYERELPAIRAVLAGRPPLDLLIIDGYVDLDPDGRPGLGAHVHDEFGVPVIGVAKTRFRTAPLIRARIIVVGQAGPVGRELGPWLVGIGIVVAFGLARHAEA